MSSPTPRPKKKPARRDAGRPRGAPIEEAVLLGTLEELATVGLEGLRVERIAERAEVNKTSIYRRWPTREALVTAALAGVLADVSGDLPDTGSLRGDLLALITRVATLVESPVGRAVVRTAIAESSPSGVADLAAKQLTEPSRGALRAVVARAKARDEWRAAVSAEQLVFMLVGAVLHRALLEHGDVGKRWLGQLVDLAVFGVAPR